MTLCVLLLDSHPSTAVPGDNHGMLANSILYTS